MILAVDIGNTSIKVAAVDNYKVFELIRTNEDNFLKDAAKILDQYPQITDAAVCKVGHFNSELLKTIQSQLNVFIIGSDISLPFANLYKSKTLGNDRMALVAGAISQINSSDAALIIDAGTCVTYDYLDTNLNYHGGAISPGLRLRYESLHNFTANLPLLSPQPITNFIGDSTINSIHSGVINGLLQEIKGCIKQYRKKNKNIHVFITGGDAQVLSTQLKSRFFATPFLMLYGIYYLYNFNKKI